LKRRVSVSAQEKLVTANTAHGRIISACPDLTQANYSNRFASNLQNIGA
jgi:hypothetical protein